MAKVDFHGGLNKYAVHTGASFALSYLNDPIGNLPLMKFHSDLPYVEIVNTLNVTFDLNRNNWGAGTKVLGAHGQSFIPIIFGKIVIDGTKIIPIQGDWFYGTISHNIFCDATNVKIQVIGMGDPWVGTTPKNVTAVIHIANCGMTAAGALVMPPRITSPGLDVTPTRFRAGYFDTNNGHLHKSASGDIGLQVSRSMDVQVNADPTNTYGRLGIYYNSGMGYGVSGMPVGSAPYYLGGVQEPVLNTSYATPVEKTLAT